ncbi:ABC transporter permease [Pigmentiphaga litoralis]|uniref:Iron(III) transport system permease protein n=1 Tax=Pigmentiphaga litoralis TaxID=516702 RepID=A0A7Y9IYE0_9BURK|nr:iron ABC transporter permease [Pigmentiphaga litoralis]NYE21931.1 iron(III) transport system permease protein [Pigmentiphaga litoralis]NYE84454.1 iron(III) transport system permease protein [Pigmentiphaga litoralis]
MEAATRTTATRPAATQPKATRPTATRTTAIRASFGLTGATIAALAVLVALPLAFVFLQAIFPALAQGRFTEPFGHLGRTLGDPALLELTLNTLKLGACVVALAALIGIPLGTLRGLFNVPFARVWDVVLLVPFMIPPYIAALGWIMLLQPRGYVQQLVGVHAGPLLFSFGGVVFVMTLNVLPVVYFAVSRGMAASGSRLADVGRVCGGGAWRCFWRISLPLATPGIAASLLLVFAMAIEEYGTPAALAANAGFFVLVTGIERRFSEWPIDLPGASTLSLILVALAMLAFMFQRRLMRGRTFETATGKPIDVELRALGPWRLPVTALFALVALVATVAPLCAIVATAFSRTLSGGLALSNLSWVHFRAIAQTGGDAMQALGTSLALGLGAALLTGVLGLLVAYCVVKTRTRGRVLLDALAMLPNTLPGIVVGVGLILAWNQKWWPATPYNTWGILLLAYCCLLLPYPVRYAQAALQQIGDSLEAAARVHGAGAVTALVRILLPLLAPSLLAAMLLVFAVASRELVASLLLAPTGVQTVSLFIWRQFEQGSVGQGMAMSVVTVLVTTSLMLTVTLWTQRRAAR